jgi:hypothetical protein
MTVVDTFELGMSRILPEWRDDNSTAIVLNLGAGNKHIPGAVALDFPWDAEMDPIPYASETVSQIHAYHFLEHLRNPVELLLECQRVLISGGHMNIVVPYYSSSMQAQDLDHKSQYCETTWKTLFDNPYYDKNRVIWRFDVGANVIMGIVERNLCLITQLVKK